MESKGLQVVQSGERTNTEGKPVSNLILLSNSDSDYSSLRPHLEYVSLPSGGAISGDGAVRDHDCARASVDSSARAAGKAARAIPVEGAVVDR